MSEKVQFDETLVKSLKFPRRIRSWTGNDENGRHHHSAIPLSDSPLYLKLAWKRGSKSHPYFIGNFVLNLEGLLASGFIREESRRRVRLRFFHDYDDVIYIQARLSEPRFAIGKFDSKD
jgi:hypothetical protein